MANEFHAYVAELLSGLGPISIRRMFGGAGVYAEGLIFAIIAEDTLYLKVDESLRQELSKAGSEPLMWTPKSGPRKGESLDLGYLQLPEEASDDSESACAWARKALAVARQKAKSKKQGKKARD